MSPHKRRACMMILTSFLTTLVLASVAAAAQGPAPAKQTRRPPNVVTLETAFLSLRLSP